MAFILRRASDELSQRPRDAEVPPMAQAIGTRNGLKCRETASFGLFQANASWAPPPCLSERHLKHSGGSTYIKLFWSAGLPGDHATWAAANHQVGLRGEHPEEVRQVVVE